MKIPKPREVEFSPLLWKECLVAGSKLKTVEDIYSYFREHEDRLGRWLKGIEIDVSNSRIKKLINAYVIFDILDWDKKIIFSRFKMWQLFEDLVREVLREALRVKKECTVVHVDRLPGFMGLDYIIANSQMKGGWAVGIQCKKYVGSDLPKCKLEDYGSWSRAISAPQLCDKGKRLHEKFPRKKFVLAAFNAFRTNEREKQRFNRLKDSWDYVMIFDKSINTMTPYTYNITLRELNRIIRWC